MNYVDVSLKHSQMKVVKNSVLTGDLSLIHGRWTKDKSSLGGGPVAGDVGNPINMSSVVMKLRVLGA